MFGPRPAPTAAHRPDDAGTAANIHRLTAASLLSRTCLVDLGKHVDGFASKRRVYAVHLGRLRIVQSEPAYTCVVIIKSDGPKNWVRGKVLSNCQK